MFREPYLAAERRRKPPTKILAETSLLTKPLTKLFAKRDGRLPSACFQSLNFVKDVCWKMKALF